MYCCHYTVTLAQWPQTPTTHYYSIQLSPLTIDMTVCCERAHFITTLKLFLSFTHLLTHTHKLQVLSFPVFCPSHTSVPVNGGWYEIILWGYVWLYTKQISINMLFTDQTHWPTSVVSFFSCSVCQLNMYCTHLLQSLLYRNIFILWCWL